MIGSSADILKQIIANKGLSWPQFAAHCGISYGQLLGWLMRTYLPDKKAIRSVIRATNLNEADMLARVAKDRQAVLTWATNIALQAGLSEVRTIKQIPGGRNFVFEVNGEWVLKVVCDELGEVQQLLREQAIRGLLAHNRGIPAAELLETGDIPRPWLMTRKVAGRPLTYLWAKMTHEQRCNACLQIGQLMGRLQSLPSESLRCSTHIPFYNNATWARIATEGIWEATHSLCESLASSKSGTEDLQRYIVAHESVLGLDFRPSLLFNENYDMHVCFVRRRDSYSISGMFDFGEVMVGEPSWDFVYANCLFLHQSPDYIIAFRKGYETILDFPALSLERLTLYTIWADRGISVWDGYLESPNASGSLLAVAQQYWSHWF
jgi:aminoglycoside phosphotransferase (APT) family kinase protein